MYAKTSIKTFNSLQAPALIGKLNVMKQRYRHDFISHPHYSKVKG